MAGGATPVVRIDRVLTVESTTRLLRGVRQGDPRSREELLEALYTELRAVAGSLFRGQPAEHTLQPTALVHEAWVRLAAQSDLQVRDRAHFMAIAATAMRHILIDHARSRGAVKRGGAVVNETSNGDGTTASAAPVTPRQRVSMEVADGLVAWSDPAELLVIDDSLERLARLDERQARVVEMRVFGGMTVAEVAEALDVSDRTVELDWRMARAWLSRELSDADQ